MTNNLKALPRIILYIITGLTAGVVLGAGMQFALAAWSGPSAVAPGNNTPPPLTDSTISQYKAGPLGINTTILPTGGFGLTVGGSLGVGGKIYTASTVSTDPGSTVVTKDYLDSSLASSSFSGGSGIVGTSEMIIRYSDQSHRGCTSAWGEASCSGAIITCASGTTQEVIFYSHRELNAADAAFYGCGTSSGCMSALFACVK